MSDVAIHVEGLSKRYRIGRLERYTTFRETLTDAFAAPFRRARLMLQRSNGRVTETDNTIWALKDISFTIKQGEVVGIIGHNGAGKSTLLKILSRITEPTLGFAEIRGRVGSLLEIGTGFHPELTGRENIYLNGAILGMRRAEIDRKFDEIVGFAEVERFIDTPVKRYSSGMYLRLAFAVAAHLDPEILLVDEVLAVGDATFQRRCIDRMSALARTGKTVLFVSHNMDIIPRLCKRAILLKRGGIEKEGEAASVVEAYLGGQSSIAVTEDRRQGRRAGSGRARFTDFRLVDSWGNRRVAHSSGQDVILRMQIESEHDIPDVALAVVLKTRSGTRIITSWTREVNFPVSLHRGIQAYQCEFEQVNVRPGHSLIIELWMESEGECIDSIENVCIVPVTDGPHTQHLSNKLDQGIVVCNYSWKRLSSFQSDVASDHTLECANTDYR